MVDSSFHNRNQTGSGRLTGIGAVVKTVIAQNALQRGLAAHQAIDLWPTIAGDQLSKVCCAESIREGVLFVKAKSSAWANELTFHKPELLRKLAQRIGGGVITDIRFSTNARGRSAKPEKYSDNETDASSDASKQRPKLTLAPLDPAASIDPKLKLQLLIDRTSSIISWRRENGWIECARCRALFEPNSIEPKSNTSKKTKRWGGISRNSNVCPVCDILTNT